MFVFFPDSFPLYISVLEVLLNYFKIHLFFSFSDVKSTYESIKAFFVSVIIIFFLYHSLIAQLVKNLPAMQETLVQFLGREDPREKG